MSPVFLRRYRAERLLRHEFQSLRSQVLAAVGGRLRAGGIELDRGDLEAAYALAWQGLYAVLLEGGEIESPSSWLILVTYRRAIDEHRVQRRGARLAPGSLAYRAADALAAEQSDLADELDGKIRLGQLLEGLRGRLSERERQAAALCYLQGLSRSEAASQMGISEGRMRKLMEGRGAGEPGVSSKIGELARTIEQGEWCESQGSLMRALAYGILARDGERHRLALSHHRHCPSCRAYVLALRGLASALPPTLLPGARLALGGLAGGAGRVRSLAAHVARRAQGAPAGSRSAAGAAGASGAGGGLALGGPLGAKLAVGCLMALSVGAGCIGLEAGHPPRPRTHTPPRALRAQMRRRTKAAEQGGAAGVSPLVRAASRVVTATVSPKAGASREFGPEQALADAASPSRPAAAIRAHPAEHRAAAEPHGATANMAAAGEPRATAAAVREFAP